MVASVGASFAPQRDLRCCTKPQAVFGFCSFLSGFHLQIEGKRKWTRGDSNPWPPPCEGGALPTELRAHKTSAIVAAGFRIARQGAKDVAAGIGILKYTVAVICIIFYTDDMDEPGRSTFRISEAARELGISVEWLRKGEVRGFFPPALRDRNGHRYYSEEDIERMRNRPASRRRRG